jgi:hypothetical protein
MSNSDAPRQYATFDELVAAEGMAAWRGTRRIRGRRNHGGPPCPAPRPRLHLASGDGISAGCDHQACEEDLEDTLLERARRLGLWDYPGAPRITKARNHSVTTRRGTA